MDQVDLACPLPKITVTQQYVNGLADNWEWTPKRIAAAELIGTGKLTIKEIAAKLSVSTQSIDWWKRVPQFKERVNERRAAYEEHWKERALAIRGRRLEQLNRLYERYTEELERRGASMSDAPFGKTGIVAARERQVGKGDDAERVTEYEFDTATTREMRAILEQIARELGQWQDKRETADTQVTVTAMQVVFVQPGAPAVEAPAAASYIDVTPASAVPDEKEPAALESGQAPE